jgi:flagellar hook-basal body complex protein FliE
MADLTMGTISEAPITNGNYVQSKANTGFKEMIKEAIHKVDALEKDANKTIVGLLEGKTDVQESMIALQKADISMRMLLTVRNKVLDAYREIMRMQF